MADLSDDQLNEMVARYMQTAPGSGGSQFDAPVSFPQTNYEQQVIQARQQQQAPQRMYSPSADAYYMQHPDGSVVPEEDGQEE